MLGVADPRAIQKFISAVAGLDSPAGLHLIHELAEAGADLRQINSQVAEYWRAMMLARAGANIGEILDHTDDEIREIISMSQLFALEELTEYAKIFAQNELVQRNQGTPQLGLELALLSCLALHRRGTGDQAVAASANGSGHVPTSSSASPSIPRNTRANQSHPSPPVTPATSTSLHTSIKLEAEKEASAPPNRDNVTYHDEEDIPDQAPAAPLDTPAQTVASTNPMPPVASFSQDLFLSQHPAKDEHMQNESAISHTVTETKKEEVVGPPALLIQEVKEKWEYVKRRVKSKKDGAKVAALLNGYTIVSIEQQDGVPVVVIVASALFHYTTLQQQTHYDTIEWALKTELKRDCKVRMLPPGQGGSSPLSQYPTTDRGKEENQTPLPTSPDLGNANRTTPNMSSSHRAGPNGLAPSISIPPLSPVTNSMESRTTPMPQELQPHHSAHKQQLTLVPDNAVAPPPPTPLRPRLQKPQEEPLVQPDHSESVPSTAMTHNTTSQPSPLARTTEVRENTTTSDSRLLFAQKKAKNDQVVQEVVRLFKAEVKDIQLK
jgi:DNA polymerase-3 subunit gamma/tau